MVPLGTMDPAGTQNAVPVFCMRIKPLSDTSRVASVWRLVSKKGCSACVLRITVKLQAGPYKAGRRM